MRRANVYQSAGILIECIGGVHKTHSCCCCVGRFMHGDFAIRLIDNYVLLHTWHGHKLLLTVQCCSMRLHTLYMCSGVHVVCIFYVFISYSYMQDRMRRVRKVRRVRRVRIAYGVEARALSHRQTEVGQRAFTIQRKMLYQPRHITLPRHTRAENFVFIWKNH